MNYEKSNIPLISIVVPIYNGEKYLKNCVHAILEQTWKNYEVIVVNDGSTDKTEEICLKLTQKYPQFRYYYQENAGAGAARNKGIEASKGMFLAFVDVDDYLHPAYLEELYYLINRFDAKISCCSYVKGFSNSIGDFLKIVPRGEEKCFNQKQALTNLFYRKEIMGYPVIKLMHRELIGEIRFPIDLKLGEDFLFVYAILRETDKVAYTDKILYFYTQNQDGITHNLSSDDMKATWKRMVSNVLCKIENEPKELKNAVVSKLFMLAYDFRVKLIDNHHEKTFKKELGNFIKKNKFNIVKDSHCTKGSRIIGITCCINIKLAIGIGAMFTSLCRRMNWSLQKAM